MSKGLEALKFLRRNYCVLKSERENACDTIEKELKALDDLIVLWKIGKLLFTIEPNDNIDWKTIREVFNEGIEL